MTVADEIKRIRDFCEPLGFRFEERSIAESVIPGVVILPGQILAYDVETLPSPGDLLHEAGHLAIIPEPYRQQAHGDVDAFLAPLVKAWFRENEFMTRDESGVPRENPVGRAFLQLGDTEAQAWSYAAALACGIDPSSVFHDRAYDGNSEGIILGLSLNAHPGIHGLAAAGMCRLREYPTMRKWLQDARPT